MKILSARFGGDQVDDGPVLVSAAAELTLAELVFLAKLVGRMNDIQMCAVSEKAGSSGHEIYSAVTDLLNRFFDDGADEAERSL